MSRAMYAATCAVQIVLPGCRLVCRKFRLSKMVYLGYDPYPLLTQILRYRIAEAVVYMGEFASTEARSTRGIYPPNTAQNIPSTLGVG